MGLDISHDAFSGAYSSFNRFRQIVAKAAGGSFPPHDDDVTRETHPGLWEFLSHSDCDGEISPELCAKLADEMEALLPAIDRSGAGGGHIERNGGYGAVARRFIAGCRAAHAAGESLDFH